MTRRSGNHLQASEARVAAGPVGLPGDVMQVLVQGLILHDAQGAVLQVNKAAAELLGAPAHELIGRDGSLLWGHLLGPDERPLGRLNNPLAAALSTGVPICHQLVGIPTESSVHWVEVRATPIHREGDVVPTALPGMQPPGSAREVLGVALSLSEPDAGTQTLAILRERDRQLGVIQRLARLSTWRWTVGEPQIEWNDPSGLGMGIAGSSLSFDEYFEGIHPDDRARYEALMHSLLTGRSSGEIDLRWRSQDRWQYWHMWAESSLDESGTTVAVWGMMQEVTERHEAEAAIRRLRMTDSLTELPNRLHVQERLRDALTGRSPESSVALVLLDVDRFNSINERFGHPAGDQLLVELGSRLSRLGGPGRSPGRMAGDEFALVVEGVSDFDPAALAGRVQELLSAEYLLSGAPSPVALTVSTGVAVAAPHQDLTATELYRRASMAVKDAKARGHGALVVFDTPLRDQVFSRLDMEGRLRAALADGRVRPLYQPIIELGLTPSADRVVGCEALARLHEGDQVVPPADFIEVAEASDLILDVDLAVFAAAVRTTIVEPPVPGFSLSFNLSALSLQVPGVAARLARELGSAGVRPTGSIGRPHGLTIAPVQVPVRENIGGLLRIEITESCLAQPTPTLLAELRGLRELGAHVGLDDFGTGYSALAYLRRFDLEFMKIDRSFVADVCQDERSRAVVKAIIDLAHAHRLLVIAEGVEGAEQLEALRSMGCDRAQGYYIGRPMPWQNLLDLIDR